ncbi:MAG: LBF_2804 family protein [Cytophagaceae bacterium]
MSDSESLTSVIPNKFEEFGVSYLKKLKTKYPDLSASRLSDDQMNAKISRITWMAAFWSGVTGFISAFLSVWATDTFFVNASPLVNYSWMGLTTALTACLEIYILFLIALQTVYKIADLTDITFTTDEEGKKQFPFSIEKILSRTALELSDPADKVLGIDAFKMIPKYKLMIIGLLYKGKVVASNVILRAFLKRIFGRSIMRVSVAYVAAPVTALWNGAVLYFTAMEARLRIFGYVLANHVANNLVHDEFLLKLSPEARTGCIRAVANAVVLTQNYHPNMMVLLLRLKELLNIQEPDNYDDWDAFLATLEKVTEKERYLLLDILTIAAAFDGRISGQEKKYLKQAYKEDYDTYFTRLKKLTRLLKQGRLKESYELCKVDFNVG